MNSYTVSFNVGGGSAVADQTVVYNSKAVKPAPDPTKAGYTFGGWYTDGTYATAYNFTSAITGNTTVYGKWNVNSYTVSFDVGSGSEVASQSVEENGKAVKPATNPTKAGHMFEGWYTDVTYATPYNFTSAAITGTTTIYAKWTMNPPGVPAIQSVVASDSSVAINWTSSVNSTGYHIYQSTTAGSYGDPITTVDGSVYHYQATGLTNGTPYYFIVKAVNADGMNAPSNEVSVTPQVPSPGVPVLQSALAGNTLVSLAWNAVDGSTDYKIFKSVTSATFGAEVATVSGSVYSYNVTGLTNGRLTILWLKPLILEEAVLPPMK
ncbi:InlB B-repeat-containing protein [Paenibacillus sp. N3.4]|uniref:InlB B-repeat-containing protein n=1 Tax=Paenibacillus sp. N3.4 TaxID=2603222 RepID=UPI0011C8A427|nr:InlB B-repeat-containing protein [Paenibacillus sp. N3.4]TXK77043.1 hypothetical protein FU659_23945 [Paenibacillus sp. N3.4]